MRLASALHQPGLVKETAERLLEQDEDAELRVMLASTMHGARNLKAMAKHLDAVPEDSPQAANAANLRGMMLVSQARLKEGLDAMARTRDFGALCFPASGNARHVSELRPGSVTR